MNRTFRVPNPARARRIRSGWAWLLAVVLAAIAGTVGSSAPHTEASSKIGDAQTRAGLDSSDRRS